jgi:hypothetical protein
MPSVQIGIFSYRINSAINIPLTNLHIFSPFFFCIVASGTDEIYRAHPSAACLRISRISRTFLLSLQSLPTISKVKRHKGEGYIPQPSAF